MSKLTRASIIFTNVGILIAAFSINAGAAGIAPSAFGSIAPAAAAAREITITPSTKWINVTNGETVSFVENGKKFTWNFNAYDGVDCDLSTIAPKELGFPNARVYIAQNPTYAS
jgi:hypothetical protein